MGEERVSGHSPPVSTDTEVVTLSVNKEADPLFLIDNFTVVCLFINFDVTVFFEIKSLRKEEKNTREQSVDINP